MSQLQSSNLGPETGLEKILKYAIPVGVGLVIFAFWGSIVHFIAETIKDTVMAIIWAIIGAILLYGLYWTANNYRHVISFLSGKLAAYSPLFYIRRSIEILKEKRQVVLNNVNSLGTQKKILDRQIQELETSIKKNGALGVSALQQQNSAQAGVYGGMVEEDKSSLKVFMELQKLADTSLQKMQKIYDHWGYTIQGLEHSADRKEQEWKIVQPLVKGLRSAEDFIGSNSEAVKNFGLGMKELENKIAQGLSYADEFDRRSKGVIDQMDIEKGALQVSGLKALESFMDDKTLLLPTSFGNDFTIDNFNNNIGNIASGEPKTPQFNLLRTK